MVASNVIVAALASTTLISLAPNILLVLFPHYASGEGENSKILALGQALAAGGLLGDVFLHTIPHASPSDSVGLWILMGFTIFLIVDMTIRGTGGGHSHHNNKEEQHQHHHSNSTNKSSTILLNLAADALHNFTDGLAIGASFASVSDEQASVLSSRGGLATLSILFHEIPHELGDFAILVKNGMSKNQAIVLQFGTAIAAMIGTVVGILLQGFAGESLIFMTSGGFVYLAAVNILPEILDEDSSTFRFRLLQVLSFAAGIAFMFSVTILEEMSKSRIRCCCYCYCFLFYSYNIFFLSFSRRASWT